MKKAIAAIALIAVGVLLAVTILPMLGIDFGRLSRRYETEIYDLDEPIRGVALQGLECDVFLGYSDAGGCQVFTQEGPRLDCSVEVIDGILTVTRTDTRGWFDLLPIWKEDFPYMSVYLPAGEYELLDVQTASGDIYVSAYEGDEIAFDNVSLQTASGWIH